MPAPHKTNSLGILSAYQAAKLIGVSAPTVRKWIDAGKIPGSFTLPESRDRRIPAPSLRLFLIQRGVAIPTKLTKMCEEYEQNHNTQVTGKNNHAE